MSGHVHPATPLSFIPHASRSMPLNGERELLQCLQDGPVSGDVLAQAAGLTRAAIWKRIQGLRAAGIDIQAQAGQGYTLAQPLDWLDAKVIGLGLPAPLQALLAGLDVAWSLDSTNSELLRRVTPARGTTVLLAERQTGGRGRRGREWASPLAAHLYLSLARHFHGGLARLGGLSLVVGIAVAEGLQGLGFDGVRLKWPNDLVVASGDGLAKLGGILVESGGSERVSGTADPVRAVIGIGVNVRMPAVFAEAIGQPWLDLQQMAGRMPARNAVATALLERLLPALELFDDAGLEPFLSRYAALDALAGRAIDVHAHDGVHPAHALGIAGDGALRVRMAGNERHVHAGEVSVRAVE